MQPLTDRTVIPGMGFMPGIIIVENENHNGTAGKQNQGKKKQIKKQFFSLPAAVEVFKKNHNRKQVNDHMIK